MCSQNKKNFNRLKIKVPALLLSFPNERAGIYVLLIAANECSFFYSKYVLCGKISEKLNEK